MTAFCYNNSRNNLESSGKCSNFAGGKSYLDINETNMVKLEKLKPWFLGIVINIKDRGR